MPTALDTEMRSVATDLIAEFGANVTVYEASGGFDFSTGLPTTPATGITVKASPPLPVNESLVDASVSMTDKVFYFDAKSVETASVTPELLGEVEHNGRRLQILKIEQIWSGEQIAAYAVVVKG